MVTSPRRRPAATSLRPSLLRAQVGTAARSASTSVSHGSARTATRHGVALFHGRLPAVAADPAGKFLHRGPPFATDPATLRRQFTKSHNRTAATRRSVTVGRGRIAGLAADLSPVRGSLDRGWRGVTTDRTDRGEVGERRRRVLWESDLPTLTALRVAVVTPIPSGLSALCAAAARDAGRWIPRWRRLLKSSRG